MTSIALSEFVRNELDSIAGIMTYEILVNLKFGKLSTDFASQMIMGAGIRP